MCGVRAAPWRHFGVIEDGTLTSDIELSSSLRQPASLWHHDATRPGALFGLGSPKHHITLPQCILYALPSGSYPSLSSPKKRDGWVQKKRSRRAAALRAGRSTAMT